MKYVLLVVLLCSATVLSSVPSAINYQGYLTSPTGQPLDTTVSMTFNFRGFMHVLLWTEEHNTVNVTDGYFNVTLGSEVSLSESIFTSGYVMLEVIVGSDEPMFPFITTATVPYSFRTGTVDGATGGNLIGSLSVGGLNTIPEDDCFAAGGGHIITGTQASIAGGSSNTVAASYGFIGAGVQNVNNSAGGVCTGGYENEITSFGSSQVIGGGYHNEINGNGSFNVICGGAENVVSGEGAVIGGGSNNHASGNFSTVCGGDSSSASSINSFVGGGIHNLASGGTSTVCGGSTNTASGSFAAVGGGITNTASGWAAVVPGGTACNASGGMSFAAGYRARATHDNSFVWADGQDNDYFSDGINSFNVRAFGGVKMYTSTGNGARLPSGATAWVAISDSTRKTDIQLVNTKTVLDRVCNLQISEWRYKDQLDPSIRHMGPMAQDLWNAFHLGEDSLGISTIDPDGIALAAIQELAKRNAELESRVKHLEAALLQLGLNNTTKSQ